MEFFKKAGRVFLYLFRPFFDFIARRKAAFFLQLRTAFRDPYLCGMVEHFSSVHELIFTPSFNRVRTDPLELSTLQQLSSKGTIVYVMKNRGQLEYSFFNHLFLKEGIPLARFANGCRTLFWRPLSEIAKAVIFRLDYYYERGSLADPIRSGYLEELVASGESALLNLKVSREFVFGSTEDPLEFIPPLLRAAKRSRKPVFLMTQQFLYDRHPEKVQKSWMDLLFGEKSDPGMFRKLILFIMSFRRPATVKFGEPFDLKKFVDENPEDDFLLLASKLKQVLLSRLMIEKKSITGPPIQPRERLLEKMLGDRSFRDDLEKLAGSTGRNPADLQKDATRYFMEIAASVKYSYVDLYDRILRWMFTNIYDGVDIDVEGLSRIKAIAGKNPVVLVPSHKSHVDYILLSYIFYNYDLTLPYVCAGINLNFWPVARLIRRGGGFFIRRTLAGNDLYKLTLQHYIKLLVREGYSIEFFIEGTRSRTGKLLKPKMGVLSMLFQAYLDGAAPDIHFVPLSANYERILEQKSYVRESQGTPKQKENMGDIIKVGRKLGKKFGKVYIRFAEPVSLKQYLAEKNTTLSAQSADDYRREIEDFAYEMTYHINRVSVVTSTSLVAMALLSCRKKGIPEAYVQDTVLTLLRYLEFKGAVLSEIIRRNGEKACMEALSKLASERVTTAHRDFHERFYTIDESKRMVLDYHKNNSIHFFVSIAAFSKILKTLGRTDVLLGEVVKKYEMQKILLGQEFTFSRRATLESHLVKIINFYQRENLLHFDEKEGRIHFGACLASPMFCLYSSLLDNFFESLYLTLLFASHVHFEKTEIKRLEAEILEKGRVLYMKGELKYPEALSQFNIRNSIATLEKLGLVRSEVKGLITRNNDEESIQKWRDIIFSWLDYNAVGFTGKNISAEHTEAMLPHDFN